MSHTFAGKSCRIIYNSDMSGDLIISPYNKNIPITGILAEDILALVGQWLIARKISRLEGMDWIEYLKAGCRP